jgi:hypothetical protein
MSGVDDGDIDENLVKSGLKSLLEKEQEDSRKIIMKLKRLKKSIMRDVLLSRWTQVEDLLQKGLENSC